MISLIDTITILKKIRDDAGYSNFDQAVKTLNRERLQNYKREKRKHFPKSMYQRLYDEQNGICSYCKFCLDIPARKNVIDHVDPNEQDFNTRKNLHLIHGKCNREKSSKSINQQSKESGKTFENILR